MNNGNSGLQDFLKLPYTELEELNLKAKKQRLARTPAGQIQEERLKYLTDEKRIKAVTLLFSDLEGRLHMLDYDKKFLLGSHDNLTFDGSSIRGFTAQKESDLRLALDWSAFYWAPADYFGAGKVLVFGEVIDKDGSPYSADIRGVLKKFANDQHAKNDYTLNAANEIEGFLFRALMLSGTTPPTANSNTSTPAVTTTRCPAIRCVPSSIPPPKCSVRWASRTRRTIRKWRPRSSRSTTATPKWWPRPITSSFTN